VTLAAADAASAPWWGVPVAAGLFALLGVLVAQIVAVRVERDRARREDLRRKEDADRRWEKEVREAYARFGAAAHDFIRGRNASGSDAEELQEDLIEAIQGVELIGAPEAIEAARAFRTQALDYQEGVRGRRKPWRAAERIAGLILLERARVAFINAARSELGLPPTESPQERHGRRQREAAHPPPPPETTRD
jgi:hypothetical protein